MTHSIKRTWKTKYFPDLKGDFFKYGAGAFTFIEKPAYEGCNVKIKYCYILVPRKDDISKSTLVDLRLNHSDFVNARSWSLFQEDVDKITLEGSIGDDVNTTTIHCIVRGGFLIED